jgi:FkbM family methyltransferase
MKDFAQSGHQQCILDFFSDTPTGFFIEIGANDGEKGSNCRALSLLGWSGVAVEACPRTYPFLRELYRENDKVEAIHAAVTTYDGCIDFYSDTVILKSALNSLHVDFIDQVKRDNPSYNFVKVSVPAITVESIWKKHNSINIDFLCIDAEGHDLQILESIDFQKIKPTMMMIETNKIIDGKPVVERIVNILKENRYKLYKQFSGESIWVK